MTKKHFYILAGVISTAILAFLLVIALPKSPENESALYDFSKVSIKESFLHMRESYAYIFTDVSSESVLELNVDGMTLNPLTGIYVADDTLNQRPMVVQLDNFFSARPQASLNLADVAFEILAEGSITRYMAVFLSQYPDVVGPIRSTRPYFVYKALEFDPYYVHVGGSVAGLQEVKKNSMAAIDALSSSAFYRVSHKRAPHNTYSSAELILKDVQRRGYRSESNVSFLDFSPSQSSILGEEAHHFKFVYKNPSKNDPTGYFTSYKYNSEEMTYYRYTNGKPHIDEATNEQLSCTNILVQYAPTKVIDQEGRLQIDFVGTGKGDFFSNGEYRKIYWEKKSLDSRTLFFYEDGKPVLLNPGKTWIQVMSTGQNVSIYD